MTRRAPAVLIALVALLAASAPAWAQRGAMALSETEEKAPPAIPYRFADQVGVFEQLGERVDPDAEFTDSDGRTVRIGDYLGQGKPVALTFVYHSCPMLCSMVLDGQMKAIRDADFAPGQDYTAIAVSMDPRDTPARADSAKAAYVARMDGERAAQAEAGWHFLTGEPREIGRLAEDVGFGFAFDRVTGEFAHNAVMILLSPEGVVTRYLYGLSYAGPTYRLGLVEAGEGTVGSSLDRLLLACYQYDADAQSYTPYLMGIMRIAGGLVVLLLAIGLVAFWRGEVRRQRSGPDDLPAVLDGPHPAT